MGNTESSTSSSTSTNPTFAVNRDDYTSLPEVQHALRLAGLESSNLIVGIDFTKSNEWTGKHSFAGRSLHSVVSGALPPNPYEQALRILGATLSSFDDDNLIPCFGFGDASTHDSHVFSFFSDHRPCEGFEGAVERYREVAPKVRLAGPTSFAPIVNAAVDIVEASGGQYHVLVIIADGQVTRSVDVADGILSPQEQATVDAIVNASSYALSIVLVGVGDGPWEMMHHFDDNLPARTFDNFQFINFTEVMQRDDLSPLQKEAQFALGALMEIPHQYQACVKLGLLGTQRGSSPSVIPLPPPPQVLKMDAHRQEAQHHSQQFDNESRSRITDEVESTDCCPICLSKRKNMVFDCGHQTCEECAANLSKCPLCRKSITTKIRVY